ncbi:hypothetical protein SALBM135S_04380 [Streptomyces alboniger]
MATLGGDAHPALGPDVPAVLQEVGERVRPEGVALLGGLPQPVLGGGLVAALAVVPAERVRGRRGARDGGDPPPAASSA